MDRPVSERQEALLHKTPRALGAAPTLLLMPALCAPLAGYAFWLIERHGHTAPLTGLSVLELLFAGGLLVLPFVALRLLRVVWQAER